MNKKLIKFVFGLSLCLSIAGKTYGQDPQFSQFYAAPIYLNPAFTGGAMTPRLTANYRNQWPAISANFITSSFAIDHFIEKANSGIGLLVLNDTQGIGRIKSTDFGLTYSYLLRLNEQTNVRLGVQGSYVSKSIDYNGLVFGYDTSKSPYAPITTDNVITNSKPINYMDFSAGALFYNSSAWFGVAAHHLGRPSQSFAVTTIDNKLPIKFSVHGGLNIPLTSNIGGGRGANSDRQLLMSPAFLYKRQGQFDQLDLGTYFTYSPLTLGIWYRGIPIKKSPEGLNNHDALIFLLGYRMDNFSIGYSYDLTISKLGANSGGAHEISISYQIPIDRDNSPRSRQSKKELSCPKF